MSELLCVLSPHEKGFWQADVYLEGFVEGPPDWFMTGSKGGDREMVVNEVRNKYPSILIVPGVIGVCVDCGEEQTEFNEFCPDCDGPIEDS